MFRGGRGRKGDREYLGNHKSNIAEINQVWEKPINMLKKLWNGDSYETKNNSIINETSENKPQAPGRGKPKIITKKQIPTHKARNIIAEINQVWDIPINKPD